MVLRESTRAQTHARAHHDDTSWEHIESEFKLLEFKRMWIKKSHQHSGTEPSHVPSPLSPHRLTPLLGRAQDPPLGTLFPIISSPTPRSMARHPWHYSPKKASTRLRYSRCICTARQDTGKRLVRQSTVPRGVCTCACMHTLMCMDTDRS